MRLHMSSLRYESLSMRFQPQCEVQGAFMCDQGEGVLRLQHDTGYPT